MPANLLQGCAKVFPQSKILEKPLRLLQNLLELWVFWVRKKHQVVQLHRKITITQLVAHRFVILVLYPAGDKNANK